VQPQILRVPSNSDVKEWKYPAFENTLLYERANEGERQKIISEGIPKREISSQFVGDIIGIVLSIICMVHATRTFGIWMASCFFIGSFAFTGIQESQFQNVRTSPHKVGAEHKFYRDADGECPKIHK